MFEPSPSCSVLQLPNHVVRHRSSTSSHPITSSLPSLPVKFNSNSPTSTTSSPSPPTPSTICHTPTSSRASTPIPSSSVSGPHSPSSSSACLSLNNRIKNHTGNDEQSNGKTHQLKLNSCSPASWSVPDQPWLHALLSTRFYGACDDHKSLRKNERNIFCKTHGIKICSHCHGSSSSSPPPTVSNNSSSNNISRPSSSSSSSSSSSLSSSSSSTKLNNNHNNNNNNNNNNNLSKHSKCTVLHVTRYMYHDVLLMNEISSIMDISNIQPYVNNGHHVVYIDRRAQALSNAAPNAKTCIVCDRTLQEPYKFCCIYCRLSHEKHPAAPLNLPLPDAGRLYQSSKSNNATANQNGSTNSNTSHQTNQCGGGKNMSSAVTNRNKEKKTNKKQSNSINNVNIGNKNNKLEKRKGSEVSAPLCGSSHLVAKPCDSFQSKNVVNFNNNKSSRNMAHNSTNNNDNRHKLISNDDKITSNLRIGHDLRVDEKLRPLKRRRKGIPMRGLLSTYNGAMASE